jgi:hypothetical protein
MPRLTAEQWERARAEYEVRGVSLGQVAKIIGTSRQAVSKRAIAEGWAQGKSCHLVRRKVAAAKEIMAVDAESCALPATYRHTLETVVGEQLEEAGIVASLGRSIAAKGLEILRRVDTPTDLETMARVKRHLSPPPASAKAGDTTVNVQAQAQAAAAAVAHEPAPRMTPEALETMRRLLRGE